jgi:hypothetical protein
MAVVPVRVATWPDPADAKETTAAVVLVESVTVTEMNDEPRRVAFPFESRTLTATELSPPGPVETFDPNVKLAGAPTTVIVVLEPIKVSVPAV